MVQAGKARIFADEDTTDLRISQETLYSLGSRKNDSSTGAVQFGQQSGFVPPAQSGLQDMSKLPIDGGQMEGALGFTLKLAELDVGTGILDIARDVSQNLFKVVPNDVIVSLSAGVTSNLEFIEFAKFEGHRLRLYGIQGNTITIIHTAIGTANAIKCPTDVNFVWLDDEIIDFTFNVISGQWHLMTGVGPSGGGGAFANQTLSNLTPNLVRVNTDLEPDTTATHQLGTTTLRWLDLWLSGVAFFGSFDSAGIGGAGGDFNANFFDIDAIAVPANPPAGTRRVFVDTTNSDALSVRTSGGTTVSLEAGAGAGFANQSLSNLTNPTSINQDLIPQANLDLGTTANPWDELHVGQIDFDTTGVKDGTKHQILVDSPNNNLIQNVPIAEEFEWCENGIPHMNLNFARLSLTGLNAGLSRTGSTGTFDEFINSTTPGIASTLLGLQQYEGFDSISQQTIFAETSADLISPIAGGEIGNYLIRTTARGIQGGLTYEQNDDVFSFSHFGEASITVFFDIVHDAVAVNPGTLDIVQRFRGQNDSSVLQDMVRFEMLFQDRTPGSEDVKFDIQVQRNSAVQSFMAFNDSGDNKIRSRKNFNLEDNLLELNTAGDLTISATAGAIDYNFPTGLEYFMTTGAFFVGDAGPTGAYMQVRDLVTPGTPVAGRGRIFLDSADNILKIIHDDTTVKSLEASGAGSQTPWLSNINADGNTLLNIPNIDLVDTGGFGDGRITFDASEDSDTWIGNDNVTDQVRFVANAVVQALYNPSGWRFTNDVDLGTNFMSITGQSPASIPTPAIGVRNLFVDNTTGSPIGQISVKTSDGTTVSLEGAGGGGGADTDLNNLVGTAVNQSLIPDFDNLRDLGSPSREWRNAFFDGAVRMDILQVDVSSTFIGPESHSSGDVEFNDDVDLFGNVTRIGNSTFDKVRILAELDSSLIPDNDGLFDLGTINKRYRQIFSSQGLRVRFGTAESSITAFQVITPVVQTDNILITGDLAHGNGTSDNIGFFNTPVTSQKVVPFSSGSQASNTTAINTLIIRLRQYGLLG